ncbi:oxidoreductase [Actinoallomurus bryophytorum]|uniref:Membrane-associated oxidoreductase n=1 Tax=Actinoallomurus bryophytorum TaxID=1490222 RepID=A0A543BZZ3_9ACTN|nr:hypothetical protein [Actinoallomurus bryophytorum]TQL90397.1 hypothetical protein FB559_7701 [Actinoallomurus bryophytorum]
MTADERTEAESLLWRVFPSGEWADLRTGSPDEDDVGGGDAWGPERTVRAETIQALLLGAGDAEPGRYPAVRLRGARVTGRLDLMGATVRYALVCEECCFDRPPRFVESTTKTVRIVGSRLPGFNGARMRTDGILNFHKSRFEGGIWLERAKVIGEVTLRGAVVGGDRDGVAVAADGLTVDGNLECNQGFTADGVVRIRGARITGSMNLDDARLSCSADQALDARNVTVDGWFIARRAIVDGEFGLTNAVISGWLDVSGSLLRNPGRTAFGGGGLTVGGGLWCHLGYAVEGEMRLVGARLGGNLTLTDAGLTNPGGTALNLDRATLGELDAGGLTVTGGQVSLVGTEVAGRLSLARAHLNDGVDGMALTADGLIVGTLLMNDLRSHGTLMIRTARVAGRVSLVGAELNSSGTALRLSRIEVGADVFCANMTATGQVKLSGARIDRQLNLRGARLSNPGGVGLDARSLRAGELILHCEIDGSVELHHARIGVLRDDPDRWPSPLCLDGLTYETLEPPLSAKRRLTWLSRDPDGCPPQPYEQLAAFYAQIGQPSEARQVLYARELHRRDAKTTVGRIWSGLQDVTVGYGYRSWRAMLWLALLLVLGSVLYGFAPPAALKAGEAPHFNPVMYTLDLLLPIVDLGQQNAFNPAGAEQWISYLLVAAGWILATTIAAGIARVITRR